MLFHGQQTRIQDVRKASEIRNKDTQRVVQEAKQFIRKIDHEIDRGVGSKVERDELIAKVRKKQENLEEAKQANRPETEIQQIDEVLGQLREKEQDLAKTEIFTLKRIKTHLDRKQRKVIQEILEILHGSLDQKEYAKVKDAIMEHFEIKPES
jgi:hypothetical protein